MGARLWLRPVAAQLKYHYSHRFFTYPVKRGSGHAIRSRLLALKRIDRAFSRESPEYKNFKAERNPHRGQCQAGSLTGAVHLSNGNAGVLRRAQRGRKPRVEQKGKSSLDLDSQYEYRPRKRGLSILLALENFKQEVSEKLPQG